MGCDCDKDLPRMELSDRYVNTIEDDGIVRCDQVDTIPYVEVDNAATDVTDLYRSEYDPPAKKRQPVAVEVDKNKNISLPSGKDDLPPPVKPKFFDTYKIPILAAVGLGALYVFRKMK